MTIFLLTNINTFSKNFKVSVATLYNGSTIRHCVELHLVRRITFVDESLITGILQTFSNVYVFLINSTQRREQKYHQCIISMFQISKFAFYTQPMKSRNRKARIKFIAPLGEEENKAAIIFQIFKHSLFTQADIYCNSA